MRLMLKTRLPGSNESAGIRLSLVALRIAALLPVALCSACDQAEEVASESGRVDASSLHGKVMCGYQGWFRTPGDGQDLGWKHYRGPGRNDFRPGAAGIDFWPDLTEFADHERFDTPFKHADGSTAQVFSSAVRDTALRHFRWMEEYGIDGVFVQRFATEVTTKTSRADHATARSCNVIVENCRAGAAESGRTYAMMYDLTGMTGERLKAIRDDWRYLVTEMKILEDEAYQQHRGRPVLAIWGVGFGNDRKYGPKEVESLVKFFKDDPVCGGLTIMLGTSTGWRTGERDAASFDEWASVYRMADVISPWTITRYRDVVGARKYAKGRAKEDQAWCDREGIDFMPVVFPGFSWANLKAGTDQNPNAFVDRDGGRFLWSQYHALVSETGAKMVYQAMFDELDEGTQIFKASNDPPVGQSRFQSYEGLPSDHYLWLVGEATKRVRRELPFEDELPERVNGEVER